MGKTKSELNELQDEIDAPATPHYLIPLLRRFYQILTRLHRRLEQLEKQ